MTKDDPIYAPIRAALHDALSGEATWAGLARAARIDGPALHRFARGKVGLSWEARDRLAAKLGLVVSVQPKGKAGTHVVPTTVDPTPVVEATPVESTRRASGCDAVPARPIPPWERKDKPPATLPGQCGDLAADKAKRLAEQAAKQSPRR